MTKFAKLKALSDRLEAETKNFRAAYDRYTRTALDQSSHRQELANLRKERSKEAIKADLGEEVDIKAAAERDARIALLERLTSEGALEAAAELVEERRTRALEVWGEVSAEFSPIVRELLEEREQRLRAIAPDLAQIAADVKALRTTPSSVEPDMRLPSALGHGDLLRALPTPKPSIPDELVQALDLWLGVERTLNRPMQ